MKDILKTRLPKDADLHVDFTEVIQGHVGQSIKQVFTSERERTLVNRELNLMAREYIVKDQFGNLYVVFTSVLGDGEVYAVTDWVGAEKWTGVAKATVLVRDYKRFRAFNDDLLAYLQHKAFLEFGRANLAILKSRHAANLINTTGTN